ncbi:MAG: D-alanyl-D-alanine carboxypeptidase family protein [Candidatus Dormibacteria bacterium]
MLTRLPIAATARRALIAALLLATALLAPATRSGVHMGARPADARGRETASPPPFADGDTRDEARTFPLQTLDMPIVFRESTRPARGPAIVAASGIMVDIDRNEVLWSQAPHARRAPASTAKLMSALVALRNFSPEQVVTVTPEAADVMTVETRMELQPGERLTARELLAGMLMISANDATKAVASGTVGLGDFVAGMNRQARALGLQDSHFANPVGFPDEPDMYSSAYDLAAIATAAFRQYPLFGQLTATRDTDLAASPMHRDYRMHNINRLPDIYPAAVGTKSGYTDEAGPCLVSMAVRGNHRLVAVLMNSPKMFDQSRALLEWGFGLEGQPPLPPPPPAPPWVPAITH